MIDCSATGNHDACSKFSVFAYPSVKVSRCKREGIILLHLKDFIHHKKFVVCKRNMWGVMKGISLFQPYSYYVDKLLVSYLSGSSFL